MKNRKIFVLLILIYITMNIIAVEKSFIWKIDGGKKVNYLVGSIHVLKAEQYPLTSVFEESFKKTDCLVVEANVSSDKVAEIAALTMELGLFKGGKTLKGSISQKTYEMTEKKLKKLGMNIANFSKFKPWLLGMTITARELMGLGFDPNMGIDKHFLSMAKDKEIIELEGARFQIELFDGFNEEEQENFLFEIVSQDEDSQKEFDKLYNAWKIGDSDKMDKLVKKNIEKYPELKNLYKKLLYERNIRMVKNIDNLLKSTDKSYYIVVGAAHLVGKGGLIDLLIKRGYSLDQL